jgi:hypothetical protein
MKVCEKGHVEIVYDETDGRDFKARCPLCSALELTGEFEQEIALIRKEMEPKKTKARKSSHR